MFEFIILDILQKLNRERSSSAAYHILTGKRSSQTIQDVHIFQTMNYFGIYKALNKELFDEAIFGLIETEMVMEKESSFIVSEKGRFFLDQREIREEVNQFKGLEYDRLGTELFDRLVQFIQLAANLLSSQNIFIPISENQEVLNWTKQFYLTKKQNLKSYFDQLYQELYRFLLTLNETEASIFVDRLTGYNRFGLSKQQIQNKYQLTIHDTHLLIQLIVHKLITWIKNQRTNQLILYEFLPLVGANSLHTASAEKTYELLKKGFAIDKISKIRGLKKNTIYDHIIEVAYQHHDFDPSPYLEKKEFDEITTTMKELNSKRLKALNEALEGKYSYFQIRLALAVNEIAIKGK